MSKNILLLCHNNSALSIVAEAVLGKYLQGVHTTSAAFSKVKPIEPAIKKALQRDGSWSDTFESTELLEALQHSYDLVIILSKISKKQTPEFDENSIVIQIEYEEPDYKNSSEIERFIKTIKMELIPITRDVLDL